jgi:hypothetical protein
VPDPRTAEERLLQTAASHVRGEGVCEKPHRNGERNPHVHFNDAYIARGRDIAWAAGVLRAALAVEPVPAPLDVLEALASAVGDQHRYIETVNSDGDDWYGCICGERGDDCSVLSFLGRSALATPPEPKGDA